MSQPWGSMTRTCKHTDFVPWASSSQSSTMGIEGEAQMHWQTFVFETNAEKYFRNF